MSHQLLDLIGPLLCKCIVVIRNAQGHAAGLGDHTLEQFTVLDLLIVYCGQDGDVRRTRGVSEDRYIVRISSKGCDVLLDPLQGSDVIQQSQVLRLLKVCVLILLSCRDLGQIRGAKEAQSVVAGYHNHIFVLREVVQLIRVVGRGTHNEPAAVEPYHDRLFLCRVDILGPHIQGQAVFTDLILGSVKDPADGVVRRIRQRIVGLD